MKTFSEMLATAKQDDAYWVEAAKLDFALELTRQMKLQGVNNAELARRLGTSAAYVTKLLRGDGNLTIETMVKAGRTLDCDFHTHLARRNASVRWLDSHDNEKRINPEADRWVKSTKEPHREPIPVAA
ncbi:MAG: helix-turn-helix transcriptional regulator [Pseudomonadota bacterium]